MEKQITLSLADSVCDVRLRKSKMVFLNQINVLLDWASIRKVINKHYKPKNRLTGAPAYSGLLLFKMTLLQSWYGLSDYEVEEQINDSLSFSKFLNLSLDTTAPDHSTLSRFRKCLTDANAYDDLLAEVNRQLEQVGVMVKKGAIVDASITDSPLKPRGKAKHLLNQDEKQADAKTLESNPEPTSETKTNTTQIKKEYAKGVDEDGGWVKKANKLRYGYKKHHLTNMDGLVLGVVTTPANVNEISNLEDVLNSCTVELPAGIQLQADKGYASKKNEALLKERNLKSRILKKAKKNKPLTDREKQFNKLVGKTRYKVERTFGSIKRWFKAGSARYKGQAKTHSQHVLEALCYNLYRSPGIIASNAM